MRSYKCEFICEESKGETEFAADDNEQVIHDVKASEEH